MNKYNIPHLPIERIVENTKLKPDGWYTTADEYLDESNKHWKTDLAVAFTAAQMALSLDEENPNTLSNLAMVHHHLAARAEGRSKYAEIIYHKAFNNYIEQGFHTLAYLMCLEITNIEPNHEFANNNIEKLEDKFPDLVWTGNLFRHLRKSKVYVLEIPDTSTYKPIEAKIVNF
ncbi:MAG: hypothetical protein ACE5FT_01885 [Candidatus Nanoarchaeia archaeon]